METKGVVTRREWVWEWVKKGKGNIENNIVQVYVMTDD